MDYIFDMDGTLVDCDHRLVFIRNKPKNFKAFYSHDIMMMDEPLLPMIEVARTLAHANHNLIFCTGRSEECRHSTITQIRTHIGGPFLNDDFPLYMRPNKDYRPDYVVKSELHDRMLEDGFNPIMVFEDRPTVCRMWKDKGLLVARIGEPEDF